MSASQSPNLSKVRIAEAKRATHWIASSTKQLADVAINPEPQCLALTEASRSSLLSKSVRSSASSSPRSICGTSFTNAGLCVTVSITAHMSRPVTFSITYRTSELSLENRVTASTRLVRLTPESRHSFIDGFGCLLCAHERTYSTQQTTIDWWRVLSHRSAIVMPDLASRDVILAWRSTSRDRADRILIPDCKGCVLSGAQEKYRRSPLWSASRN